MFRWREIVKVTARTNNACCKNPQAHSPALAAASSRGSRSDATFRVGTVIGLGGVAMSTSCSLRHGWAGCSVCGSAAIRSTSAPDTSVSSATCVQLACRGRVGPAPSTPDGWVGGQLRIHLQASAGRQDGVHAVARGDVAVPVPRRRRSCPREAGRTRMRSSTEVDLCCMCSAVRRR